ARQAHNLKVIGSNPIPATKHKRLKRQRKATLKGGFFCARNTPQDAHRMQMGLKAQRRLG
ncbi:hypothetical protein, partial [Komagataeibacter intermedius]|uniref:hypothetical protein n=1 Tax=Komagataeibacter intermedius TaxID=66229 RepID=UPI002231FC8F